MFYGVSSGLLVLYLGDTKMCQRYNHYENNQRYGMVTAVFNCDSGISDANLSQYVVKVLVPVGSLVPANDCMREPMTSDQAEDCFNMKLEPFRQRSTLPSWHRGGGQLQCYVNEDSPRSCLHANKSIPQKSNVP